VALAVGGCSVYVDVNQSNEMSYVYFIAGGLTEAQSDEWISKRNAELKSTIFGREWGIDVLTDNRFSRS
jgi:hypothetical protein